MNVQLLFRWAGRSLAMGVAVVLVWVNVALHCVPLPGSAGEDARTLALLRNLKDGMHGDLPERMQHLFPEGAPFSYALYGLAWCELSTRLHGEERSFALEEAGWSLLRLESDSIKARFHASLPGHGAFLAGWTAYLHGRLIFVSLQRRTVEDDHGFQLRCEAIARAVQDEPTPYMPSYHGQAWPADVTVCVAALALHDHLFEPSYSAVIGQWVSDVRTRCDTLGMLPHAWYPNTDQLRTGARGSSMALMNVFLPAIDTELAVAQFALFRRHFFTERFGLPAVREHPKGTFGAGDIDSGPLILGIGPAATIVAAGACRVNGDAFHAHEFASIVDAFGFAVGDNKRSYLMGALPIADLFIAWCRAMPVRGTAPPFAAPLFLRFHAWSALALLLVFAPWLLRTLRMRRERRLAQ